MGTRNSKSSKQSENSEPRETSSSLDEDELYTSDQMPRGGAVSGWVYECFLICPMGDPGSDTRKLADKLRKTLENAANSFKGIDIRVSRGDDLSGSGFIPTEVVDAVRRADFCVIDISEPNPNVYFEFGLRQGIKGDAGRDDMIVIKRNDAAKTPVDINGRRYIDYDRNDLFALQSEIEKRIGALLKASNPSVESVEDKLVRIEDKIDKLLESREQRASQNNAKPVANESLFRSLAEEARAAGEKPRSAGTLRSGDASDLFKLAIRQSDIPRAEAAMDALERTMPPLKFYDMIVEQVAGLGSDRAGQMLIDFAPTFMSSGEMPPKKKLEYLSFLVTYCNRSDRECECMEMIEGLAKALLNDKKLKGEQRMDLHNQLNRLYSGAGRTAENEENYEDAKKYLVKAADEIKEALSYGQKDYLYANLASNYNELAGIAEDDKTQNDYLSQAKDAIDKCMANMEEVDGDYLAFAYAIYRKLDAPGYNDILERLRNVDPIKAELAAAEYDE